MGWVRLFELRRAFEQHEQACADIAIDISDSGSEDDVVELQPQLLPSACVRVEASPTHNEGHDLPPILQN